MATINFLFKTLVLLITTTAFFIEIIDGVKVPMQISKDVAKYICRQRTRFAERRVLEEPITNRYRPISPLRCGWYSFGNCDNGGKCSYQKYDHCAVHIKEKTILPSRIHGGKEAELYSHPSMVLLKKKLPHENRMCGSVIIAEDWVLTAAHCTHGVHEQDITLLAGRHWIYYVNVANEEVTEQRIEGVKKIHEHFRFNGLNDDICLLELYPDKKFVFNRFVGFSNLAPPNYNAIGKATLVGWGKRNDGWVLGALQEVEMTIISWERCRRKFGGNLGADEMCTYDEGKSGCDGDSGGPLYQFGRGGKILIGIETDSSQNCSLDKLPTVYSDVSHYLNWISDMRNRGRANIPQTL